MTEVVDRGPYFARRCAQRADEMAVVAVAHRLCRILFALLRDGAEFDVAQLAIEEGPFRRTSVQRSPLKRPPARRRAQARERPDRRGIPDDHGGGDGQPRGRAS